MTISPSPGRAVGSAETARLVRLAQAGDRAAQDALVAGNKGLVVRKVRQLEVPPCVDRDDLIQEGMYALWRAVLAFDPGRGFALSSYAARAIVTACLHHIDRTSRNGRAAHEPLRDDGTPARPPGPEGLPHWAQPCLSPSERDVVHCHAVLGLPLSRVPGVAPARARQLWAGAVRKLRAVAPAPEGVTG